MQVAQSLLVANVDFRSTCAAAENVGTEYGDVAVLVAHSSAEQHRSHKHPQMKTSPKQKHIVIDQRRVPRPLPPAWFWSELRQRSAHDSAKRDGCPALPSSTSTTRTHVLCVDRSSNQVLLQVPIAVMTSQPLCSTDRRLVGPHEGGNTSVRAGWPGAIGVTMAVDGSTKSARDRLRDPRRPTSPTRNALLLAHRVSRTRGRVCQSLDWFATLGSSLLITLPNRDAMSRTYGLARRWGKVWL